MAEKFDIKTLSKLARIHLSEKDEMQLANDLRNILTYVEKLDELDTSQLEATSHVLNIENVFREDIVSDQAVAKDVLAVLPDERKEGQFFKVPKVIED